MDKKDLEQQNQDRATFGTAFNQASAPVAEVTVEQFHSPFANRLRGMFTEYEAERREQEDVWLKNLRQHRGEYDPDMLKKFHPKRSKAFLSITRTKDSTVTSRMTDLLFPPNGEKNWGIDPTPVPDLNPQIIQSILQQYQAATGQPVSEDFIRQELNKEARKRCEAMECEMNDQLTDLRYRHTIRQVIKDGNIYGTGILKGPLIKRTVAKRWLPNGSDWVTVELEKYSPWCEHIRIWDWYPDMSAREIDNCRGVFQRHLMSRHKVWELAKRKDFNKDAIKVYLKSQSEGDAVYKNWEQDLQVLNRAGSEGIGYKDVSAAGTSTIGTSSSLIRRKGKYEVLEYWGYISSDELMALGIDFDEEKLGVEVAVNIWLLGGMIIKAVISSVDGAQIPYHIYYYEKDDTSIFGTGIPEIMRDAQKLLNSAVRAMLDNAAISAGPIIEVNTDLLDGTEDPRDIYPFRVFLRDGAGSEATAPAVRVYNVASYTSDFMAMIQFFMNMADEVTAIPRYLYGDTNQIRGAGKTATGLSMLMGAANVTLKEQVKNFDDGVTKPFIRALYSWNMDFNPKEHIKGDYGVTAKGSTSLIAREVRMESLMQFLNYTNNPTDLMYTKRGNVLGEMTKCMDLSELDLIKDKNEIKMMEEQNMAAADEEKQFVRQLAMIKATSGGHMAAQGAQGINGSMGVGVEKLSQTDLDQGKIPQVSQGGEALV